MYLNTFCVPAHLSTQYEYGDVLDGFWGPGDGCRSDTGSETVPGPIFASSNFLRSVVHS